MEYTAQARGESQVANKAPRRSEVLYFLPSVVYSIQMKLQCFSVVVFYTYIKPYSFRVGMGQYSILSLEGNTQLGNTGIVTK